MLLCMAHILKSILQSVNRVITLVEKRDLQLNQRQCRCLAICVKQVKDYLFSGPIRIHRQLLERIWRTVKKVESFVIKCCNKDWLVNTLSVGVSEEEIKDFILELRWCLNHVQGPVAKLEDQGQESQTQRTPPQMVLPSEEDIRQDRQSLVNKLQNFLSGCRVGCEKRALALYLQGRLKILEGEGKCKLSLKRLLWKLKLPEPSKYEHLGRGSSALVFKTLWLGIPSAMKSLSCYGDKFLREAGTLAMLNHPNIVKLYCCYEDRKHQSLVMELMDESLYDLLHERSESRNGSPFELEETVDILLQIVKGMLYLHKNGFAHRDLKSLNILVSKPKGSSTGDLIVKVADFELVKLFDPTSSNLLTVSQKKAGTHVWRAPEVLRNDAKINPRRADIYSFGMVFYEVFTGKIPFYELSSLITNEELHKKIVYEGFRPSVPEDCPVQLRALIEECWHANPELRPTFAEIYDRLLKFRSLMLETSVIETQDVQRAEAFASTRAMMPFVKMWEYFLSLCMNKHQLQISNTLQQLFNFRMGSFIKMWESLLSLRVNHTLVDSQISNSLEQRLECLSPEEALDELEEAIDQAPNNIHALNLRAEIRLRAEDFKGSLADLDKMNVLQPNDGLILKRRGQLKHMLGDYEGALRDLDDAMKFIPNDSCLLIQRAQAKKMRKDDEGALKDLNAADHLAPHDALILRLRGEMKKNLEDFTGALQDFNEALDLSPHDVTILNEIAHVNQMWDSEYARRRCQETALVDFMGNFENVRRQKSCGCNRTNCPLCTMWFFLQVNAQV